ncbi:MAG: mobile mystery protein B [Armatimonadetes bacterium]|nr:mobile mystery protein B [Armatimonadota bacterium]
MAIDWEYPEGATPLDPEEALDLIPGLATQSELNEFEAINILEGSNWARRSTKIKRALLEQETLRLLHKNMFGQTWRWAGSYRKTQKNIGCEAYQISSSIKILKDDVQAWIKWETYAPEEIAARFHHRLVWIHPFANGNGRFARLATDLLCEQQHWPAPTWGATDLVKQSQTRTKYIKALQLADRNDFASLMAFMKS